MSISCASIQWGWNKKQIMDSTTIIFQNHKSLTFHLKKIMRFSSWKSGKINAKGMDMAQPIWLSGCSKKGLFITKKGPLGWFKNPVSSQTDKLMAGTKFSDYLGLKHYKQARKGFRTIRTRRYFRYIQTFSVIF